MKKILLLLLVFTVFACRDKRLTDAQRIVNEWMGKEIRIPDNILCTVTGKDTASDVCRALLDAEYKVLLCGFNRLQQLSLEIISMGNIDIGI
ncbi:MAG: hypothetical protein LBK58_01360 [Prevotellaceae bacterium]|jgi:hypothetical protein|nr:hypothetical protein [Prevotellaceae bacterium]